MRNATVVWLWILVAACADGSFAEESSEVQGSESLHLLDSAGSERPSFEVGESVLVTAAKLAPIHSYRFVVRDGAAGEVLSLSLVTDREGTIAQALLWPDLGLGSAPSGYFGNRTIATAQAAMAGRSFVVELWDKQTIVTKTTFSIAKSLQLTRLFASSKQGEPMRALREDHDGLWVTGRNFPAGATLDVILVSRRNDWRVGDPIDAVEDPVTGPVVRRIQLDSKATGFTEKLWKAKRLVVGHYQADRPPGLRRAAARVAATRHHGCRLRSPHHDVRDHPVRPLRLCAHRLRTPDDERDRRPTAAGTAVLPVQEQLPQPQRGLGRPRSDRTAARGGRAQGSLLRDPPQHRRRLGA